MPALFTAYMQYRYGTGTAVIPENPIFFKVSVLGFEGMSQQSINGVDIDHFFARL
jgi:hypothetical protein